MFSRRVQAALDIGTDSVRYAAVEPDSGRIRALWEAPLLPGRESFDHALSGLRLKERVVELLSGFLRQQPGLPRAVATALNGEATYCRYIELPPMSARELNVAVPTVAHKHLPFPVESANISYVPVPQLSSGLKKCGIFLVAAQKEAIKSVKEVVEGAGLEMRRLDITPLAVAREFSRNHDVPAAGFNVLVHVGFRLTQVVVVRQSFPYYVRQFPHAGRNLTRAIQMAEPMPWDAAEHRKTSLGEQTMEPALQRWMLEVARTLAHVERQGICARSAMSHVWLSGGGAALRGLASRLQEALQRPVSVDAWNRLKADTDSPNRYKAVVGMALEDR